MTGMPKEGRGKEQGKVIDAFMTGKKSNGPIAKNDPISIFPCHFNITMLKTCQVQVQRLRIKRCIIVIPNFLS